jgi:hypothetical protein
MKGKRMNQTESDYVAGSAASPEQKERIIAQVRELEAGNSPVSKAGERDTVTPIPWQTAGVRDGLHLIRNLETEPGPFGSVYNRPVCNTFNSVDAEFIVSSCNSHAALLAALREIAESYLTPTAIQMRARAAIAQSEGGK